MNHYAIVDGAGRVVSRGATPAPLHAVTAPPGGRVVALTAHVPTDTALYFDGTSVRAAPPAPSLYHRLEPGSGTWHLDETAAWVAVRAQRDRLLTATDWRLLRAAETGVQVEPEWLAYRQALRDVTKQGDPTAIEWPTPVASMPPINA